MKKNKQRSPLITCHPKDMLPLEQILCMIWLANNHTLQELRQRQSIIEAQFVSARQQNCQDVTFENLTAMQNNTDAAVAYQTWPQLETWQAFIWRN